MKKFFSYFMISLCLLGTSVVTSCSSDDDDKEDKLPELPYVADAAIYHLEDNKEGITYIELTTAGNYFIQYEDGAPKSSVSMKRFECGTFTKNSEDNTYQLEGKNTTLKIEHAGGDYNIILGDKPYPAMKKGTPASLTSGSPLEQICRSWKVKNVYVNIDSSVLKPFNTKSSNYKDLEKQIDDNGYVLPYFVALDYISFSSTYWYNDCLSYVGKTDDTIGRSVWQWKNNAIILDESGKQINVTFEGSTMKLSHKTVDGSTTIEWGYELTPAPVRVR